MSDEERRHPPFTELGMLSLALIIAGGIYLSSNLPRHVALGPAIALLAASAVLVAINVGLLTRVQGFAWARFVQVAKWALLAYAFTAGMIEYAFVRDHLSGGALVAVQVPALIAFTVARFESSPAPEAGRSLA
jgi:hypothetical protein